MNNIGINKNINVHTINIFTIKGDMKNITERTKKERIYPIFFNNKWYYEKDVDDIFAAFYHTRYALGFNCSVYVSEGLRICPDGTWIDD